MKELPNQIKVSKAVAIKFAEYISDEGWIKDPFPRQGHDNDIVKYTNVAVIDNEADLKILTIEELWDKFNEDLFSKIVKMYPYL